MATRAGIAILLIAIQLPSFHHAAVQAQQSAASISGEMKATVEAHGTAIIQTGSGTILIRQIEGVDPEEHRLIAAELGVTKAALTNLFKILKRKQVPPEDLDSTLREIAKRYKELDRRPARYTSEDPVVVSLKTKARAALEAGEFERAELLQNKASARDVEAAKAMKEAANQRLLSAASSKAENADLKSTQLAYAEAAAYYREAAELVPEGEELARAEYLNNEGLRWIYVGGNDAGQGQEPLERALSIREKVLGPEHPYVAQSLNNLAGLFESQDRYAEAEPLFQRALGIWEKALGPEHTDVATSLNNLAALYSNQSRYAEAELLYQRALGVYEKVLGPEHTDVATSLNNLAALYSNQSRYAEAEPLFQRALGIWEKALGPEHSYVAQTLNNLAGLYESQGRYAEAEPLFQRACNLVKLYCEQADEHGPYQGLLSQVSFSERGYYQSKLLQRYTSDQQTRFQLRTIGPNVFVNGKPARDEQIVRVGDRLETGPDSSAYVYSLSGGFIQLDENTD